MIQPYRYKTEVYSTILPIMDYIARFRDADRIEGYCKSCNNYGKSWACPPFTFNVNELFTRYRTALIIVTKVIPEEKDIPFSESGAFLLSERKQIQERLLEMERLYNGRSFAYTGICLYCPEGTCTRSVNRACRHPELIRPSLEACGFDISRTTAELFNIELKWGENGCLPEYLVLACAFFHNQESILNFYDSKK